MNPEYFIEKECQQSFLVIEIFVLLSAKHLINPCSRQHHSLCSENCSSCCFLKCCYCSHLNDGQHGSKGEFERVATTRRLLQRTTGSVVAFNQACRELAHGGRKQQRPSRKRYAISQLQGDSSIPFTLLQALIFRHEKGTKLQFKCSKLVHPTRADGVYLNLRHLLDMQP